MGNIVQRVGERVVRRPASRRENPEAAQRRREPDKPESTVQGRPENSVVAAQGPEGLGYVPASETGNVRPDHDHGPRRHGIKRGLHPLAQVPARLRDDRQAPRPGPGRARCQRRRCGHHGAPSALRNTPERTFQHETVDRQGAHRSECRDQSGLDLAEDGSACHHDDAAGRLQP